MSKKDELLNELDFDALLELAKSVSDSPIKNRATRADLQRIVKGTLSIEEIKRKIKGEGALTESEALSIVGIFVVLGVFPLFLSDYYISVSREVLLWVALAVSWDFFSGSTKYISLGSAAFFGIGLYTTAGLIEVLPLPFIVPLAALLTFGLALVIGLVTLRLRGIYFVILTFAFAIVVQNLIAAWEILVSHTRGTYIDVSFSTQFVYYAVFVGMIVVLLLVTLLRRSKFGLGLRMIGESEEAAVHVGVNASMHKTLGFAVSAMLMGLMGACFTTRYGYLNTDIAFDTMWTFMPAVMVLLGGIGTVYGPIIGAVTLSLLRTWLSSAYPHYFLIILGIILVAVVILMPNGIMGLPEQIRARSRRRSREKLPGTKKKKAS